MLSPKWGEFFFVNGNFLKNVFFAFEKNKEFFALRTTETQSKNQFLFL